MRSFLCQNVPIFPLYILLTRRIKTFGLKVSRNFGLEGTEQFCTEDLGKIFGILPTFHVELSTSKCLEIPFNILFTYYPNYLLLD